MSGDRNEHMLPEIVMKSWCEMSHSPLKLLYIYQILIFFTEVISEKSSKKCEWRKHGFRTLCFSEWLPTKWSNYT
jgi:hypothetical protein